MAIEKKPQDKNISQPGATVGSSRVQLSFRNHDGTPASLKNLEVRASSLCGRKQGCWQKPSQYNEQYEVPVPADEMLQIEAQGMLQTDNSKSPVSFLPALVVVACNETKRVEMFMKREKDQVRAEHVTVTLRAHRCMGREDRHDHTGAARVISATAVPQMDNQDFKAQKNHAAIHAKIVDGVAFFSLKEDRYYRIDARMEGECAGTCPTFPVTHLVEGDCEISVCVEPRERVVKLLFVDGCGEACEPSEVVMSLGGETQPLPTGQGGTYTLTGVKSGRLKLISDSCRFRPDEIEVDHRMSQVHLFEAITFERHIGSAHREELVLEFAETIREGDRGSFRILTIEGKLVETLDAIPGRPVLYSPASQEALLIQGWRNGQMVDQVAHPALNS